MATLAQVKQQIGISSLELVTATDNEGNKTDWLRHWDNDRRIAVSIHKDLAAEVKNDTEGTIKSLSVQYEQKVAEQGPYDAYRIIKYNSNPEVIL